jgi:hypothetical protein
MKGVDPVGQLFDPSRAPNLLRSRLARRIAQACGEARTVDPLGKAACLRLKVW